MSDEARLRSNRIGDRMIALFLLGVIATGPPILGIVDAPAFVLGVPLLFAWLFSIWTAIIALLALSVARRSVPGRADAPPEE